MDTIRRITRQTTAVFLIALLFATLTVSEGIAASKKPQSKPAAKEAKAPTADTPAVQEPELNLFKEATFLFPKGARVSSRWVIPPTDASRYSAMLSVDPSGSPIIGTEHISRIYLLNPLKEYMMGVEAKISGFTHLDNGVLLLASGNDIGLLAIPDQKRFDEKNVPIVGFQPLTSLPLREISVLSGAGNSVYCAGLNTQTGRYSLYMLRVAEGAGIQDIELIHESSDAITAVTGNEDSVFIAKGNSVVQLSRKDWKATPLYTHPSSTITGLALTSAGLLASTGEEIVLAGENGAIEIMRSSGHQIAMRKDILYVLFKTTMGILAIENIADLKRFNLAVQPITAGEATPPLTIADVRFFESGPPPYTSQNFAESFNRDNVRRIVSQIDFKATSVPKDTRQHTVTVSWYEPNGGKLLSASYPVAVQSRGGTGQVIASIGGKTENGYSPPHWKGRLKFTDSLANRYPGQYHMLVHVDGVPVGEWSFSLTGPVKPADAISYDDLAMLQTLLTQGLSPRSKEDGEPILNSAVKFGSTRAVELLLKNGADPNDTDKEGMPSLAKCSWWLAQDWRAKAELLVRYGANVNALVGKEKNPLVHNSSFNPDFTAFLVEKGADINARNAFTKVNLWEEAVGASRMCTDKLISLLIGRGSSLYDSLKEGFGGTDKYMPLGFAISLSNYDCVELLLSKGAPLSVAQRKSNRPERSALYVALERLASTNEKEASARRIVRLLLSKGAKLAPGKKFLTSSIFNIEDFNRQLDEESAVRNGEGRIMFQGESLSFFDAGEIIRALETDDAALYEATRSKDPAVQDLALKYHLARVRELTYAARKKSDLMYFVNDHCKEAFKLAEARYRPMQLDVVPDVQTSSQGSQGNPFWGAALLKRDDGGAYVQRLVPGSPAERAGLKVGDIILALDTQKMKDAEEIVSTVSRLTPGTPVRVTFLRDDPMRMPELPLTCGVLETSIDEKGLAEMNLSRWLAANPDAPNAKEIRELLNEVSGTVIKR
jgi:ankyrin repeat protein